MPVIVSSRTLLFRNPTNSQTLTVKPSARPVTLPDWVENDPTYKAHLAAGTLKNGKPVLVTEPPAGATDTSGETGATTPATPPAPETDATALAAAKAQIDAALETAEAVIKTGKTNAKGK